MTAGRARPAVHGRWLALVLPLLLAASPPPLRAVERTSVVVELFTAQGCAACPPAQAAINALADRADVLTLSFPVTYWDALGWRDRFAQPAFTERQRRYAAIGRRALATPQVILNGRLVVVFCLADCWMSWNAALRLRRAGYAVLWFAEGSDGWRDLGRTLKPVQPYMSRDRPSE